MGRLGDLNSMPVARKALVFAVFAASTALTASAFADTAATTPAPAHKSAKPSTKSSSATKSTSAKTAKALAPGECGPTPDQASIGLRALQTDLMVAGLKCSADQWNSFTAKFKATIKTDADRLQKVFAKAYGKGGANQMNAFVTQLANDASQRSNAFSEADYCKQQDVLFGKVLALTALELERFSAKRTVNVPQPVKLCAPDADPAAVTTTAAATPGAPASAAAATLSKPTTTGTSATNTSAPVTPTTPVKTTPVVATAAPPAATTDAR